LMVSMGSDSSSLPDAWSDTTRVHQHDTPALRILAVVTKI
jgi:hypothetical protein